MVLFCAQPPGYDAIRMRDTTFRKKRNRPAIRRLGLIRVRVVVDTGLHGALARRYHITQLPTLLLLLDSQGRERNRRTGMVGELDFRDGFLNASRVVRPEHMRIPSPRRPTDR